MTLELTQYIVKRFFEPIDSIIIDSICIRTNNELCMKNDNMIAEITKISAREIRKRLHVLEKEKIIKSTVHNSVPYFYVCNFHDELLRKMNKLFKIKRNKKENDELEYSCECGVLQLFDITIENDGIKCVRKSHDVNVCKKVDEYDSSAVEELYTEYYMHMIELLRNSKNDNLKFTLPSEENSEKKVDNSNENESDEDEWEDVFTTTLDTTNNDTPPWFQ